MTHTTTTPLRFNNSFGTDDVHMWEATYSVEGSMWEESGTFDTLDEARRFVVAAARRNGVVMRDRRVSPWVGNADEAYIVGAAVTWHMLDRADTSTFVGYGTIRPAVSTVVEFDNRDADADATDCTVCPLVDTYGDEAPNVAVYGATLPDGRHVPVCASCAETIDYYAAHGDALPTSSSVGAVDNASLVLDYGYAPRVGAPCRVTFDMDHTTADALDEYTSSTAPVVVRRTYPATVEAVDEATGAVTVRNGHTVHADRVSTTVRVECGNGCHEGAVFGRSCLKCSGRGYVERADARRPAPVGTFGAALVRAVASRADGARFVTVYGSTTFVFDTFVSTFVRSGALVFATGRPAVTVHPIGNGFVSYDETPGATDPTLMHYTLSSAADRQGTAVVSPLLLDTVALSPFGIHYDDN